MVSDSYTDLRTMTTIFSNQLFCRNGRYHPIKPHSEKTLEEWSKEDRRNSKSYVVK